MGSASHSVLKSLSHTVDVPHVVLRDANDDDPITKPSSPEVPASDSDSRYQLQREIARGGMGAILKSLRIRLSPGGLPWDSPFRSSGTAVTFSVDPTELSKSEIPWAEIRNLKASP
jgi:hypothetical protein